MMNDRLLDPVLVHRVEIILYPLVGTGQAFARGHRPNLAGDLPMNLGYAQTWLSRIRGDRRGSVLSRQTDHPVGA
jgi:hypothetical protein